MLYEGNEGRYGANNTSLTHLIANDPSFWGLGADVLIPIFDGETRNKMHAITEHSDQIKNLTSHRIEIKLRDINQLFNTMDASPFHEKDLDDDAEEFIVSWAQEFPTQDPLILSIHVSQVGQTPMPDVLVETAVRHYFSYRASLCRLEFRRLLREGRLSLVIGLLFLSLCLIGARLFRGMGSEALLQVAGEGLIIAGWVAMWRPLEICLYDWWPIRRRWKIFQKLGQMKVEIFHQG